MPVTTYGDISPRTAAYASKEMLERGLPLLVFEKFMQAKVLPANNTKSMSFRRYNSLPLATTPLTEGVTPTSKKVTTTDVVVTLNQHGDLVELTDVVLDTHEDPVIREHTAILGEQAAQTVETIRFNVLKAGTNKFYANGSARTDVNTALSLTLQKKIVRALKRQNAMKITSVVKSSPSFNTEAVLPSYIAIAHTDLENDIRAMTGFIDVKNYGSTTPMEGEIGAVNDVRYILTNICTPYADGGGNKGAMVSTSGTKADVYPVIYLAKNAWAGVALKGAFAITPIVINPVPSKSDPLGQRGSIAWKTMQGAVILNDAWMAVAEVAATEL
ncbi:MAG: N4-gp56 family major capsid protein [Alphaproteobacteria bacterium]|uniref:N4-gp56 family major capsid protein n=1 Tax=Candidatus Nitrobium versatile TaxID=2884831 RepID=A0A953M3S2_9BACT|nr:N4-gp56 family major capsid protein [Candidatus Nitrobium versatile]